MDKEQTQSIEVLLERVSHLRNEQREIKNKIAQNDARTDKVIETLREIVTLDMKANSLSAHVKVLQETTKDYPTVRDQAKRADASLGWITKIVIGAVVMAIMGMVLINKGG